MPRAQTWTQQTMLPPEAVEAVLRVGVVGSAGHVQCQVEARDATTGELLAMWSDPHQEWSRIDVAVDRAATELIHIVREIVGPF